MYKLQLNIKTYIKMTPGDRNLVSLAYRVKFDYVHPQLFISLWKQIQFPKHFSPLFVWNTNVR